MKRLRKVVNYAALDPDTDISDDEFSGFAEESAIKSSSEQHASVGSVTAAAKHGRLKKMSSSSKDHDGIAGKLNSQSPGRLSVQDKVFQRDLAAALEQSRQNPNCNNENVDSNDENSETSNIITSQVKDKKIEDNAAGCPPSKIEGDPKCNQSQANPENDTIESNAVCLPIKSLESNVSRNSDEETSNILRSAFTALKSTHKRSKIIDSDSEDDFCPSSNDSSISVKKLKVEKVTSNKRRSDVLDEDIGKLASDRKKRTCKVVISDLESEDEWAESEELDEDDLSEGSDFENEIQKKTTKTITAPPKKSPKVTSQLKKSTPRKSKVTKCNASKNKESAVELMPTDHLTDENQIQTLPPQKHMNAKDTVESPSAQSQLITSKAIKITSLSKIPSKITANCIQPTTSCPTKSDASFKSTVSTAIPPRLSSNSKSDSPRPSKTAFKNPVANSSSPSHLPTKSAPSVGLRLGLSRRSRFKPLHPNANCK